MNFATLLGLLPFLASAQAYFILSHPILTTTRLDPIVTPGQISSHVHSIAGGSNFDISMSYDSARASGCTTAPVSEDKSNYWIPQLYYYNPKDQSYQAIPVGVVNTYYLPRYGKDGKVQAFPDGLRMISGSPNRRTFNNDADSKAVTYVCLDYSGSHSGDPDWAERNSFFTHNCPNGMRAQIFFPSCWDGVNLDSSDHQSHMEWPSGGVDGGECPASHPVRLVSLFYEFIFNVQQFPFNDVQYPTWVFANGDTTGYGMHGDFLNGWPSYNNGTNILQKAIDGCNDNNGVGGVLSNCPPFVPYLNQASANACGPQNLVVNEDVGFGHSIAKLPGDNPIWIGNGTKPSYDNYTETATNFTDFKSVIPTGYTETGCIAEGTSGRALNALNWNSDNMTRGACVSYCQQNGFPLAGVQYGRECRCDTAIRNGGSNTTLLDSSKCGMKCAGNSYENCGGSSVMNLFNNPGLYPVKQYASGWSSLGCYTEATSGRALTGYSFTSSQMTQDLCISTCASKGYIYAGAEWSSECYCGNSFGAGAVKTTDSQCANTCAGDSLTTCGGSRLLNVFGFANSTVVASSTSANVSASATASANSSITVSAATSTTASANSTVTVSSNSSITLSASSSPTASANASSIISSTTSSTAVATSSTAAVPAPSGWAANGCMTEASGMRALSGYSTSSDSMTYELCTSACAARGFKYAGVEYSRECYCGDAFNTGSVSAPDAQCANKCSGNSTLYCGGSNRLTTFVFTGTKATYTPPTGWNSTGCYAEPSSGRALGTYTFANDSMTIDLCLQTAKTRGFTVAGLQYSKECWMANSIATGASQIDDSKCSMTCAGDLSTRCGGSRILSVYTFTNSAPAVVVQADSTGANWTPAGCRTTGSSSKAFVGYSVSNSSITPDLCMTICGQRGYAWAGIEYGQECRCGTGPTAGSVSAPDSDCKMKCAGDSTQICGAASRLTTFQNSNPAKPAALPSGWSIDQCYSEPSSGRGLKGYGFTSTSMTPTLCAQTCQAKGYTIAGTENGNECYCDNAWQTGAAPAIDADCAATCTGALTERCGGSRRLNVYVFGNKQTNASVSASVSSAASSSSAAASVSSSVAASSTVSSSISSSATSSSTAVSSSASPAATTIATASSSSTSSSSTTTSSTSTAPAASSAMPTNYVGCYRDVDGNTRVMNGTAVYSDVSKMTNDVCIAYCAAKGFPLAGTQYNRECRCGTYLNQSQFGADTNCNYGCGGDGYKTMCGGSWWNSVYSTGNGTVIEFGAKPAQRRAHRTRSRGRVTRRH